MSEDGGVGLPNTGSRWFEMVQADGWQDTADNEQGTMDKGQLEDASCSLLVVH
jgi:hypothetical protein